MKIDMKKSNNLLLLAVIVFVIFMLFSAFIIFGSKSFLSKLPESSFSKLEPGVSSEVDVKTSLGEPDSIKNIDGKTEYVYEEPNGFQNTVLIEKDKVKSSQENVFSNDMGFLSNYKNKYGNPDLVMYEPADEHLTWHIFLKAGIGVATFNEYEIAKIIYFKPQNQNEFLETTAQKYGLTQTKTDGKEEPHVEEVFGE